MLNHVTVDMHDRLTWVGGGISDTDGQAIVKAPSAAGDRVHCRCGHAFLTSVPPRVTKYP